MPTETPDVNQTLSLQLMTLRVIWVSLLMAIFAMGVVLVVVPIEAADPESPLPILLGVISIVEAGVAFFMRWKLMGSVALVAPSDLRVNEFLDGEALLDELNSAMNRYRVGTIVGIACAESIAVFGLVSWVVTAETQWFVPFAAFAALLVLVQVPRVDGVRAVMSDKGRKGLSRALGR
jgi:hypothetical protein